MLWKQNNSDCPEQKLTFQVKVNVAIDFQSVFPNVAIYSRESKMNRLITPETKQVFILFESTIWKFICWPLKREMLASLFSSWCKGL